MKITASDLMEHPDPMETKPVPVDPDEHCPDCGRLLDCVGRCSKHGEDRRSR